MKKTTTAFTLAEILVVISIIGILSTILSISYSKIQANSRNSQRSSKTTSIATVLEKYYSQNGEYPSCSALTQSTQIVTTTTLKGVGSDALTAPSATVGTNSITCPADTSALTSDVFGYVGGGSSYILEYLDEVTKSNVLVSSRHS
jgi:prepilin-type N-terminal cleavage/methylation domain-containing protein